MSYLKYLQNISKDRVGARLILFGVAYLLWTVVYLIPKAHGIDATVSAEIQIDFLVIMILILISYLLRRLILKPWSTSRTVVLSSLMEVALIWITISVVDQLIGFSPERGILWQYPVTFSIVILIIHAGFYLLSVRSPSTS